MKLSEEIIKFLHAQPYTIITTIGKNGCPHNSCKGIVNIDKNGTIYLLDLYKGKTLENLRENPRISITAVNEHRFTGYCLKGRARIGKRKDLRSHIVKSWEDRIKKRITTRLIKNLRGEKGHPRHPEALLPKPEYLIVAEVNEVIDLTPHHIKQGGI